jgi:hypothetical protein
MSLFNVGFVIFPHLTSGGRGQRQRLGPDRGYRGQFSKGEILPHSNTANTREKLMETLVANRPRLTRWILCRSDGLAPRAGQNRARAVCFDPDYREATRVSATFPVAVLLLSKHGQRSHNRSSLTRIVRFTRKR